MPIQETPSVPDEDVYQDSAAAADGGAKGAEPLSLVFPLCTTMLDKEVKYAVIAGTPTQQPGHG
jgi:hypothetical protein